MNDKAKSTKITYQKSLTQDLTLAIILIVAIISVLTSFILYGFLSYRSKTQYNRKSIEYMIYLQDNLEIPLWNMDRDSVAKICRSFNKNEDVELLIVSDYKDAIVFAEGKEESKDLIKNTISVTYQNKSIGKIILGLTPKIYQANNRQMLMATFLTMMTVIIGLALGIRLILKRLLERPLDSLIERIHKIREGEYDNISLKGEHSEIVTILENFNRMARQVARRENALTLTNQQLTVEIEERKLAEQELTKYRDHLEDLIRERTTELTLTMEKAEAATRAKSAFLANMSHELRTPLTAIIGFADLLFKTELNSGQRNYLDKLRTSSHALLEIINDILDFSKIEAGRFGIETKFFRLRGLLDEIACLFGVQTEEKNFEFIIDTRRGVPAVISGDPFRIRQVLINLAGNAVKFTEAGEIRICVEALEEFDKRPTLKFSVKDTGIGIPEDFIDEVFSPFTQTDASTSRKYGGTGLGLAISKQLVELMGGQIGVRQRASRGSDFFFSIPVEIGEEGMETEYTTTADAEKIADTSHLKNASVLLVEDHPINRELIANILKNEGIIADIAKNGKEAVEASGEKSYDAILMDIRMPEMDGYEATLRIQKTGNEVPIIAMTASAMEEDRKKCMEAGMSDYASKPIHPESLIAVLAKWIEKEERSETEDQTQADLPPVSDIPEIALRSLASCIDIDEGLRRCKGNNALFFKLLRDFVSKNADMTTKIKKAVHGGDTEDARNLAHTLKGLAGNLSAKALHRKAAELEAEVETPHPDKKKIGNLINNIEKSFAEMAASIHEIDKTREKGDVSDGEIRAAQEFNPNEIKPLLTELHGLLASHRTESQDILDKLIGVLSSSEACHEARRLEKFIEVFDFDTALASLMEIERILGL